MPSKFVKIFLISLFRKQHVSLAIIIIPDNSLPDNIPDKLTFKFFKCKEKKNFSGRYMFLHKLG